MHLAICGEVSYAINSFLCRFNYFLAPNNLTSCFRSKHTFPEKLLKGVDGFEKVKVKIVLVKMLAEVARFMASARALG